ncbi:hypothetical protein K456DRAFT_1922491 [Colletotrichum gloeosporioides 23]|nr:hypothetical protein K456DRAFT_1922491 [Colletotrichum gloeosporioides 23]
MSPACFTQLNKQAQLRTELRTCNHHMRDTAQYLSCCVASSAPFAVRGAAVSGSTGQPRDAVCFDWPFPPGGSQSHLLSSGAADDSPRSVWHPEVPPLTRSCSTHPMPPATWPSGVTSYLVLSAILVCQHSNEGPGPPVGLLAGSGLARRVTAPKRDPIQRKQISGTNYLIRGVSTGANPTPRPRPPACVDTLTARRRTCRKSRPEPGARLLQPDCTAQADALNQGR